MKKEEGACLVCGRPLVYFEKAQEMECAICHGKFRSCASCEAGHFVCDRCHGEQGIRDVIAYCMQSSSRDPVAMMQEMMEDPYIHMHGPEHHGGCGASLRIPQQRWGNRTGRGAWKNEGTRRKVSGRILRLLGLLRRGCKRGHVPEHCNRNNAAFWGILGPFQPNDRGSAFGHWQDRRPPVL